MSGGTDFGLDDSQGAFSVGGEKGEAEGMDDDDDDEVVEPDREGDDVDFGDVDRAVKEVSMFSRCVLRPVLAGVGWAEGGRWGQQNDRYWGREGARRTLR